MKVYSDTLTTRDLYECLPSGVGIAAIRQMPRPRKRSRGWELSLEGCEPRHTRRRNSGMYGADGYGYAATWDDHGVWMAALYERDHDAHIAWYDNRAEFYDFTAREHFGWRYRGKGTARSEAPWLNTNIADELLAVAARTASKVKAWPS